MDCGCRSYAGRPGHPSNRASQWNRPGSHNAPHAPHLQPLSQTFSSVCLSGGRRDRGVEGFSRQRSCICVVWWTDAKFDFSHLFYWERIAIVTDAEWMRRAAQFYRLFGFLIGEIRAFPTAEASKAREWIVENQQQ